LQHLILIDDDREEDQISLEKALAAAGVLNEALTVSDGAEALRYLKGEAPYSNRSQYPFPSIMFLDLRLPRVSGWDILSWIKANSKKGSSKVFIHTESLPVSEVRRIYALNADSYLAKPISAVEVLGLIHQFPGPWEIRSDDDATD